MTTLVRVYGGICIYLFLVILWYNICFVSQLKTGYYVEALRDHLKDLAHTNYSFSKVKQFWGPKAREWSEQLLSQDNIYWKTKYKVLLSAAIVDRFFGYNRLALESAKRALELQPGSINALSFLADFYRDLEVPTRERACIEVRKMVIESRVTRKGWSYIRKCAGK